MRLGMVKKCTGAESKFHHKSCSIYIEDEEEGREWEKGEGG